MDDSSPRHVGRPWQMAPYAPQVAQWLREDPNLSGAEILRRVRIAGYRGGKSAFYELVKLLRVPGSGYMRCPRCRALLRDTAAACRHCGLSLPLTVPGRQELYACFKRKFGGTTSIEVVGERRAAERRTRANGPRPPAQRSPGVGRGRRRPARLRLRDRDPRLTS